MHPSVTLLPRERRHCNDGELRGEKRLHPNPVLRETTTRRTQIERRWLDWEEIRFLLEFHLRLIDRKTVVPKSNTCSFRLTTIGCILKTEHFFIAFTHSKVKKGKVFWPQKYVIRKWTNCKRKLSPLCSTWLPRIRTSSTFWHQLFNSQHGSAKLV